MQSFQEYVKESVNENIGTLIDDFEKFAGRNITFDSKNKIKGNTYYVSTDKGTIEITGNTVDIVDDLEQLLRVDKLDFNIERPKSNPNVLIIKSND